MTSSICLLSGNSIACELKEIKIKEMRISFFIEIDPFVNVHQGPLTHNSLFDGKVT